MDQNQLKTAWKTRIIVGVIAFLMLFSTVAVYALIVLSNENEKNRSKKVNEEIAKIEKEIDEKRTEVETLSDELSKKYFNTLSKYRSMVKPYNANTVDNGGLKTKDIVKGNGKTIEEGTGYYSYYIGWCADESVFDSSFDSWDKPKSLIAPLEYNPNESSLIAGWEEGVIGMKIGGIREIDIPSGLAYGDTREICGKTNSPLKFIVYAVEVTDAYKKKIEEYNTLVQQYYVLYYSQNQGQFNSLQED